MKSVFGVLLFLSVMFSVLCSRVSGQTEISPQLPRLPKSASDHSGLLMKAGSSRRGSSPLTSLHLNTSSTSDKLKPLTLNRVASEWIDCFSPDIVGCHSPLSPRSSRFTFSPCHPLSPICPCSPDLSLSPQHPTTTTCGNGEWCPWTMELLRGGLSSVGSVGELCHGAVLHAGELLEAQGCCLSLVKKDCDGRNTLEEAVALMELGNLSERNLCSHAHMELVKGIMGCVLASGSPMNLRDVTEVNLRTNLCTQVFLEL